MIFTRNQRKILENLAILSRVQEDTASIEEKEEASKKEQNESKGDNWR